MVQIKKMIYSENFSRETNAISPDDFWVERKEDVSAIVQKILKPGKPFMVILGKRGSGKTGLVLRGVIPAIPTEYKVYYGACSTFPPRPKDENNTEYELWTILRSKSIIFLDDFERIFNLNESEQVEFLSTLARHVSDNVSHTMLVLMVNHSSFARLFSLRSHLPSLLDNIYELSGISQENGIEAISRTAAEKGIQIDQPVIEALQTDMSRMSTSEVDVGPDFLQVINSGLIEWKAQQGDKQITLDDYKPEGAKGILERYLNTQLNQLPKESRSVAKAILEAIVLSNAQGNNPDFEEIITRFNIARDQFERVFSWLKTEAGLLTLSSTGSYNLFPKMLEVIIEEGLQYKQKKYEYTRQILRTGLRNWQEMGTLIPKNYFEQVHAQKENLILTEDEIQLMFRSALIYEEDEFEGATEYWMARLREEQNKVEILLSALFDRKDRVRGRAAYLLRNFHMPEVRTQLHLCALRDTIPWVRKMAVESLENNKDHHLRDALIQEVEDKRSPYRLQAISALKVFKDKETSEFLFGIVKNPKSDPSMRKEAIEVLGAINNTESVDQLFNIALQDEDFEDREEAAHALSGVRGKSLLNHLFSKLREERRQISRAKAALLKREKVGPLVFNFFKSLLTLVASFIVHGLILFLYKRTRLGLLSTFLELVAILIIFGSINQPINQVELTGFIFISSWLVGQVLSMSVLLKNRREKQLKPGSYEDFLGVFSFLINVVTTMFALHGLAHMVTRRMNRGAVLLGFEVLGIGLTTLVFWLVDAFYNIGDLPTLTQILLFINLFLGFILFFVTYLYDVGVVLFDTMLFGSSREARRRLNRIYSEILKNGEAAEVIMEKLEEGSPKDKKWAGHIVKRFFGELNPTYRVVGLQSKSKRVRRLFSKSLRKFKTPLVLEHLKELWKSSEKGIKKQIIPILISQPTEDSLKTFRALMPRKSIKKHILYFYAIWKFRFRVWPKPLVLGLIFGLPLIILLFNEGVSYIQKPWRPLAKVVKDRSEPNLRFRKASVSTLAMGYPNSAIDPLTEVLNRVDEKTEIKQEIAANIGAIAADDANSLYIVEKAIHTLGRTLNSDSVRKNLAVRKSIVDALAKAGKENTWSDSLAADYLFKTVANLRDTIVIRQHVVKALREMGTSHAVFALQRFVSLSKTKKDSISEPKKLLDNDELARQAVKSIGQISSQAAIAALRQLEQDPNIGERLRMVASQEADKFDLLGNMNEYYSRADYANVISEGKKIKSQVPENRQLEFNTMMGESYYYIDQFDSAIMYFEKAYALQPTDVGIKRWLSDSKAHRADLLRMEKRYEKAIELINEAKELFRDDAFIYGVEGMVYFDLQEYDSSLTAFRTATRILPHYKWAHAMTGWVLYKQGKLREAIEPTLKAIDLDPYYELAYIQLRDIYHKLGADSEAESQFQRLQQKYPNSMYPGLTLSFIYHEYLAPTDAVYYEKAYQLTKELLAQYEKDITLQTNFVENNLTTGRYNAAISLGRKILADPFITDDTKLDLRVLLYIASNFLNNEKAAGEILIDLFAQYRELPNGFDSDWSYQGTINYIRTSQLNRKDKDRILRFIQLVREPKSAENSKRLQKLVQPLTAKSKAALTK